ncbi:hypothetical protein V5740_05965 [Croceibacterium sp. TMG7-5b_MA50]|uniref:hypothetical protein n=1 Tax=Croceibacterium sp. TMG7-5b_MA50 TaxID=3121290 RepID=UPI003221A224
MTRRPAGSFTIRAGGKAGAALLLVLAPVAVQGQEIDRQALVTRHNVTLEEIDPHAPVMIGNGELGFTADITGLQTFADRYSPLAPLLTMAQWAWHSFPNPEGFTEADGLRMVEVPGRGKQPYAAMTSFAEQTPADAWLRANPHRFSLARIGFVTPDGGTPDFSEVAGTRQQLDLWSGALTSSFTYGGVPVEVVTRMHPDSDALLVEVQSKLIADGRLGIAVRYPSVAEGINPDPTSFAGTGAQSITVASRGADHLHLSRTIDDTQFWSTISASGSVAERPDGALVTGKGSDRLTLIVRFEREEASAPLPTYADAAAAVAPHWHDFWQGGAAVDFTGSTDPRAAELERRVVLSQYLSALNSAGSLPPQEEGLFSNSWFGKFHLEMHPWHSAWQPLWGRPELLERSMGWYLDHLPAARAEAARHGVEGAWWPKMVGPEGRNSPSPISPYLMWQQPHPILLAELLRRSGDDAAVTARYAELVEASADLLASWPVGEGARRNLGPPLIPAQENYPAATTVNPTFEVEYFRWGLATAQAWRERQGLPRKAAWDTALAAIAPPATADGLYLPVESLPDFWEVTTSAECSGHAAAANCRNRDHPSLLMAHGFIGGERIDPAIMARTYDTVKAHWDLRQTWGWDFPMLAMTAARLGRPDDAVAWLFAEQKNNQWGPTGMTPRVHYEGHADDLVPTTGGAGGVDQAVSPDGPDYKRAAETYFPSNGSLLMAVALMAGGWDGAQGQAPGFPRTGWVVRAEGFTPAP